MNQTPKIITNSIGTEIPLLSPFQEGFSAYCNDKTPRDGPYHTNHPNHEDWQRGFEEAEREFGNTKNIPPLY